MDLDNLVARLQNAPATKIAAEYREAEQKRLSEAEQKRKGAQESEHVAILERVLHSLENGNYKPGETIEITEWRGSETDRKVYDMLKAASHKTGWFPYIKDDCDITDRHFISLRIGYGEEYARRRQPYGSIDDDPCR